MTQKRYAKQTPASAVAIRNPKRRKIREAMITYSRVVRTEQRVAKPSKYSFPELQRLKTVM